MLEVGKKVYNVERFEYVPWRKYTITEEVSIGQYKTCDSIYHNTREDAEKHVEVLLKDRKRYQEIKKSKTLSLSELHKLYPKFVTLEKSPKDIKNIVEVLKKTFQLSFDDEYDGEQTLNFDCMSDVEEYISDFHDVRWNLQLLLTEVKDENI